MERDRRAIYALFGKLNRETMRYLIIGSAFLGLFIYGVYNNSTMKRLQAYSKATTETYANLISEALFNKMGGLADELILRQLLRDFDMPIIITDMRGSPQIWKNIYVKSLFWKREIAEDDNSFATQIRLKKAILEMEEKYPGIPVYGQSRNRMGMLYYDDSNFISGLRQQPFFEIGFILFFILAFYYVLNSIRRTERGNLWVGLMKETAHQLGTPLTSLVGWIDYLKLELQESDDDEFGFGNEEEFREKVATVTRDMSRDVERLRKVTNRFSQIGSKPVKILMNLQDLLDDHFAYFSKRLPTLGKKVSIVTEFEPLPPMEINSDLFSWVLENLFKNALDAIDKNVGEIKVTARYIEVDHIVRITHRDNGKGISWDNRHAVFNPGFSTKKRGWGLGLTLARRIVEEYHHGRIYISWSQKGKGTEFTVEIPVPEKGGRR